MVTGLLSTYEKSQLEQEAQQEWPKLDKAIDSITAVFDTPYQDTTVLETVFNHLILRFIRLYRGAKALNGVSGMSMDVLQRVLHELAIEIAYLTFGFEDQAELERYAKRSWALNFLDDIKTKIARLGVLSLRRNAVDQAGTTTQCQGVLHVVYYAQPQIQQIDEDIQRMQTAIHSYKQDIADELEPNDLTKIETFLNTPLSIEIVNDFLSQRFIFETKPFKTQPIEASVAKKVLNKYEKWDIVQQKLSVLPLRADVADVLKTTSPGQARLRLHHSALIGNASIHVVSSRSHDLVVSSRIHDLLDHYDGEVDVIKGKNDEFTAHYVFLVQFPVVLVSVAFDHFRKAHFTSSQPLPVGQ
ncbi:MAG: hypothetical protein VKJ06_06020 [Vampirovibrionales bacterium]|nr:hypothetical protein [Vampirovibrionales bacterium]